MSGIIAQNTLDNSGSYIDYNNPKIIAILVAIFVGYFSKKIIATILSGLISYWIIALPAGFVMTYGIVGPKLGAAGMWIGMILGLSIFCLLGILRLKKVVGANLKTSVTL